MKVVDRKRGAQVFSIRKFSRPRLCVTLPLHKSDVVITSAVDRLSRDTTDLLVIAREMQRAGAGIRSAATWPDPRRGKE